MMTIIVISSCPAVWHIIVIWLRWGAQSCRLSRS